MSDIYGFKINTIKGESKTLGDYKGKVLLIVNTASKCGLTPQFKGLEALYEKYKDQGLEVLGFPCNQFAQQDPGENDEIQEFCQINYGVTFPMHAKIDVNGNSTHPLYQHLKSEAPGVMGSEKVKWNFTKFLVGKNGEVLERFAPATKPVKLKTAIEKALAG
jgi:glutathione peroxidase